MTTPSDKALAQAFRDAFDERRPFGNALLRRIEDRARELDAKPEQVHTCSYYCDRPGCLKDQRDELRDRLEATYQPRINSGETDNGRELDAEKGGEAEYGPGSNTGHGHVWKRPDGVTARCGGPVVCLSCRADAKHYPATPPAQAAEAVERVAKVMNGFGIWGRAADVAARAAIAAMQAGENNK